MIYLDSAATSMQKPKSVAAAVALAMRRAASTGRSAHGPALAASDIVLSCRTELAEMYNVPEPDDVVFTLNATHALNIAINSLVQKGTRVLISGYEHNSVTRPLYARRAEVITARSPLFKPAAAAAAFREQIDRAEVVICTHVSNVFGYILPIEEIAEMCKSRGRPLIIDASQSAGTLPLDMTALGAAFIAMPGHKGLLGPQGTGVLLCAGDSVPLMQGGSGSNSASRYMPDFLPDRLEAGTLNVHGIAGLLEGVRYVRKRGEAEILAHEREMTELLSHELGSCPAIRQYRDKSGLACQTGVLSVVAEGRDCSAAAEYLAGRDIAVRSGLHCSPCAHETAGTLETGTVRLSVSPFTTKREVVAAAEALGKFTKSL